MWATKGNDMRTTAVTLEPRFENFIKTKISQGRYSNANEVICAGLLLLEENDKRMVALKSAIDEGIKSGTVGEFDPQKYLRTLKAQRVNG